MNNDNYKNFLNDLGLAKTVERYVANLFEEVGFKFLSFCNDKRYDIMMQSPTGGIKKIEVKYDRMSATNNIIFEYMSWGKPSGISTSKSDYFVYVYPCLNEIWIIKTKKLKKVIEFYNPTYSQELQYCWNTVFAGDDKSSRCYLWKRVVFKKIIGDDLKILIRKDIPINEQ
mgnify:CR=1 FL=1